MEAFQRFEQEWSKWAGVENVVGCSSGTASLHLALEALQLPPKSKVLIPDYTMIACARAVTLAGHIPVFVDVTNEGLIDPASVEHYCHMLSSSDRLKAVMAVHVYGRPCNMPAIHDIAGKYDLKVIEDLAEAHCTHPHPNTHASCWSFYKNKVVFGEEGGAVAFRHDLTHERDLAVQLRSLGFTKDHNYTHILRGHNYRLSNLHAEEILNNLTNVDGWIKIRREQEAVYDKRRPDGISVLPSSRETPWVYDILIPGMTTDQQRHIVQKLWDYSIVARYGFWPMSRQQEYTETQKVDHGSNAIRLAREVIYLPLGQSTRNDIRYIVRVVYEVIDSVMSSPCVEPL